MGILRFESGLPIIDMQQRSEWIGLAFLADKIIVQRVLTVTNRRFGPLQRERTSPTACHNAACLRLATLHGDDFLRA